MRTLLRIIVAIIIHLHSKSGEIKVNLFDRDEEYVVGKTTYIVTQAFDESSDSDLCRRLKRLIEKIDMTLTSGMKCVKLDSENVSAVGKDENEKDSE